MKGLFTCAGCLALLWQGALLSAAAQQVPPSRTGTGAVAGVTLPPRYVIGVGDVISVTFWRDQTLSGDVLVRPDGMISLPLLNDIPAAGYTPEQLAGALRGSATKYITDPDVTVIVKEIHSRRVYVLGEVVTPGMVTLSGEMNVLQAIAVAGGLKEYADKKNVVIIRRENGQEEKRLTFNYNDVLKGKNLKQNILLQPGDTVVVR